MLKGVGACALYVPGTVSIGAVSAREIDVATCNQTERSIKRRHVYIYTHTNGKASLPPAIVAPPSSAHGSPAAPEHTTVAAKPSFVAELSESKRTCMVSVAPVIGAGTVLPLQQSGPVSQ